jgi:hypothetical protein
MSLQALSKQLASRGRDGDSMLVHMTPGEVHGLQALALAHGGSLTINPDTGLPEAGFLKKILPTVAGAALSMIPGVGPLMAAGIVGGGTLLATGSLERGLMAGLGAYGGAGLASGLSGIAAQQAAAQQAAQQAATFGAEAGIASYAPATVPTGMEALSQGAKFAMSNPTEAIGAMGGMGNVAMMGGAAAAPALFADQKVPTATPMPPGMIRPMRYTSQGWVAEEPYEATQENIDERWASSIPKLAAGGTPMSGGLASALGAVDQFKQLMAQRAQRAQLAAAPAVPGMTGQSAQAYNYLMGRGPAPAQIRPTFAKIEEAPWIKKKREEEAAKAARAAAPGAAPAYDPFNLGPGAVYDPGNISGGGGMASGGLADLAQGGQYRRSSKKRSPKKGGRFLRGPGDGTSDSIKACINGEKPARLADGEFVFDARTVSEIGNGSSEAGARKLYAMMDRVHAARRSAARGKPSSADKYLPA